MPVQGAIRTPRGRRGIHGVARLLFAFIPLLFGLSASHTSSALENATVKKTYRIAVVDSGSGAVPATFQDELAQLGYTLRQHLIITELDLPAVDDPLLDLSEEPERIAADVVVTCGNRATQAARYATRKRPTVFVIAGDPVAMLFVSDLARPGGNMTGLALNSPGLIEDRVRWLKVLIPNLRRLGVMWSSQEPGQAHTYSAVQAAARRLNIKTIPIDATPTGQLDSLARSITREQLDALLDLVQFQAPSEQRLLAALGMTTRVPTLFELKEYVVACGFAAYGTNLAALGRKAARCVDQILRGTKPAEMPIELPTHIELVINLKTSKALGLTLSPSIMKRADELVE